MKSLKTDDMLIQTLAKLLVSTNTYYACPEEYFTNIGDAISFYNYNGENSSKPDWCSANTSKCAWSGEYDTDCECSNPSKCWINYAKDLVQKEQESIMHNSKDVYKAKNMLSGEWVEGYYDFKENEYCYPFKEYGVELDYNTVCWFSGQYDSKANKIFEKDIIKVPEIQGMFNYVTSDGYSGKSEVVRDESTGMFYVKLKNSKGKYTLDCFADDTEVVGNVFDDTKKL